MLNKKIRTQIFLAKGPFLSKKKIKLMNDTWTFNVIRYLVYEKRSCYGLYFVLFPYMQHGAISLVMWLRPFVQSIKDPYRIWLKLSSISSH